MTTTNWTTKTGKNISMTTELIGKTSKDLIYHKISVTLDGKQIICNGRTYEKGIDCLRVVVTGQAGFLSIPAEIVKTLDAELAQAQTAAAATIKIDEDEQAKELASYLFSREMSNVNSDF